MEDAPMRPYALKAGDGWTYNYGIDFTIKSGELRGGPRLAFLLYETRAGEEPPDHTHDTEDEMFYVLRGSLTFRCGNESFDADAGWFVFLPCGIEHGYKMHGDGPVELIVITSPAADRAEGGWGGFVADVETQGELRSSPRAAQ